MSLLQYFKKWISGNLHPPKITTVVNYCTNDYKFIGACIREAASFSHDVIVPYTDHFYDGTPENKELLAKTIAENPNARFEYFSYDPKLKVLPQHWVTYARLVGWKCTLPESDYILFLDADEVVDSKRFIEWLRVFPLSKMNVIKLANYYYFREVRFQSEIFEDSVVLARKNLLNEVMIMDFLDRDKIFRDIPDPKARMVLGTDGQPLIHHYSWVRTKAEMMKKVLTWGHSHERNWVQLVEDEFMDDFKGTDFVHGYQYKTVEPFIQISE